MTNATGQPPQVNNPIRWDFCGGCWYGVIVKVNAKSIRVRKDKDGSEVSINLNSMGLVLLNPNPTYEKIRANNLKERIASSDRRIKKALECLNDSQRGQLVIHHLKQVFQPASGLDMCGSAALLTLVKEFTTNHRRDFLK